MKMTTTTLGRTRRWPWQARPGASLMLMGLVSVVAAALGSCGGSDANEPAATIVSPLPGATFSAGDSIDFTATAIDPKDGPLPAGALTWWADLYHDTHTHPLQLPTTGGSGTVTIPTRGETSDNIFYRFTLRATNSAGTSVEVTRDVMPRKAQITLSTAPAGLKLTLDGQPVTAPNTFTGVAGIERDLGAVNQTTNGRNWRFDGWSQGGAANQTIRTPTTNTTYTANFTDLGAATNQPPTVTLNAPATATAGVTVNLSANASDSDGTIARVDFLLGNTVIGSDTVAPYILAWTPASAGTVALRARAIDNLGASTDSAMVNVTVNPAVGNDTVAPTATLTAPAALADGLVAGMLTLSAAASDNVGVVGVEFQVDGVIVGSEVTAAPYTVSIDTTAWASGQHVVRARARDAAGNRSPWALALVRFGGSRGVPAGISRNESWVTGLNAATALAQAADGRLFIAEQGGAIRVVKAGVLLATPFHTFAVDSTGERGAIGITLHPNFAGNGFAYVYHTRINAAERNNRVTRLVASAGNGDVSTGVETPLVDLPNLSSASNHNGGAMKFGSDGKLYVAVGDNANTAFPQNLASVFGKMLRFNDDGTIPTDNPFFATQSGQARAVWAYGLRNPFTFAVQPGAGRMHINDVGLLTWEEINLGAAGANYGWPGSEGPDNLGAGVTAPLYTYKHAAAQPAGSGPGGFLVGFAIAGGAFYPASGPFPEGYRGKYFFADYVNRFIGVLDTANDNAVYSFGSVSGSPVDMLVGADGALYVLTRGSIARFAAP